MSNTHELLLLNDNAMSQRHSVRSGIYDALQDIANEREITIGVLDYARNAVLPQMVREQAGRATLERLDLTVAMRAFSRDAGRGSHSSLNFFHYGPDSDATSQAPVRRHLVLAEVPGFRRVAEGEVSPQGTFMWKLNDSHDISGTEVGETYTIGEYAERLLYLPWKVQDGTRGPEFKAFLTKIITDVVDKAMVDDLMEDAHNERRGVLADLMERQLRTRDNSEAERVEGRLSEAVSNQSAGEQQVINATRQIAELRPQLRAIREATVPAIVDDHDALVAKIKAIEDYELVGTVSAGVPSRAGRSSSSIVVVTDRIPMTVTQGGDEYSTTIGGFKIRLNFANSTLRVENLVNPIGGYHHPHVNGDGEFCLGSTRRLVQTLMADLNFETAIAVVLDQLGQVNQHDAYTSRWPEWFEEYDLDPYEA